MAASHGSSAIAAMRKEAYVLVVSVTLCAIRCLGVLFLVGSFGACHPKVSERLITTDSKGSAVAPTNTLKSVQLGKSFQLGDDAVAPREEEPYLRALMTHLRPRWESFLSQCRTLLPKEHPWNQSAVGFVLDLAVRQDGTLAKATIVESSGDKELDKVVGEMVQEETPDLNPPSTWASEDGYVHLRWAVGPKHSQDGAGHLRFHRLRLSTHDAVEMLLGRGELAASARRIVETTSSAQDAVNLLDEVAIAAVKEGLHGTDSRAIGQAVSICQRANLAALIPFARRLALSHHAEASALKILQTASQPADWKVLMGIVRDRALTDEHWHVASEVLVATGHGDKLVRFAETALDSKNAKDRAIALVVLSHVGSARGVGSLVETLLHESREQRLLAAKALGHQSKTSVRALKALTSCLSEVDATVRAACTEALDQPYTGARRTRVAEILRSRLRDDDERVRAVAVRALAHLDSAYLARVLSEVPRDSDEVRLAFASLLGDIPGQTAVSILMELSVASEASIRAAAVTELQKRSEESAMERVREALTDVAVEVRVAAAQALSADEVYPLVMTPPWDVQMTALATLIKDRGKLAMYKEAGNVVALATTTEQRVRWAGEWLTGE